MSGGNRVIGTSEMTAKYCAHRVWDSYTNRTKKVIDAGGVVHVREEWIDERTGELGHQLHEFRIPFEVGQKLAGVACGTDVVLTTETWKSPRGTTWENVSDVSVTGSPTLVAVGADDEPF